MPVVAQGTDANFNGGRGIHLDPSKHYYISVLPNSAAGEGLVINVQFIMVY